MSMRVGGDPPGSAGTGPGEAPGLTGPGDTPALELREISAGYGPYRALFDVSFSVPAGGATALLGSNGAGKSTVARVITGLVTVGRGTVSVAGTDVTGWAPWRIARHGVAHVPEGRGVFAGLSVEENLALALGQRAGRNRLAASLAQAYDAFPALADRRRQRAGTLSGGQQRLLSLAKVLAVPPRLLVADELSLGLAPAWVDQVYDALATVNAQGTALLVVEQQIDRVLRLATEAVVLERGSVVFRGPAAGAATAVERLLSATRAGSEEQGGAGSGPARVAGEGLPGRCGPGRARRES